MSIEKRYFTDVVLGGHGIEDEVEALVLYVD
jgi:hypothetical protein